MDYSKEGIAEYNRYVFAMNKMDDIKMLLTKINKKLTLAAILGLACIVYKRKDKIKEDIFSSKED